MIDVLCEFGLRLGGFQPGVLEVVTQYPQGALRLDVGCIQKC